MLNCDYTVNTVHEFFNNCCEVSDHISVIGKYPQDKLDSVLRCNTNGTTITSDQWVQFFVPEIVDIPPQKPDIESVSSVHSCIEIISQRVIKTPTVTGYTNSLGVVIPGEDIPNAECTKLTGRKLIIEGLLKQKVVYTAKVESQAIHSASYSIPFSVFIIIDKDTQVTQPFKIYPYIEDIFTCKLSERSVFKNTTVFIKASKIC